MTYKLEGDIRARENDFERESWLRARNSGRLKWNGKSLKDMTDEEFVEACVRCAYIEKLSEYYHSEMYPLRVH